MIFSWDRSSRVEKDGLSKREVVNIGITRIALMIASGFSRLAGWAPAPATIGGPPLRPAANGCPMKHKNSAEKNDRPTIPIGWSDLFLLW